MDLPWPVFEPRVNLVLITDVGTSASRDHSKSEHFNQKMTERTNSVKKLFQQDKRSHEQTGILRIDFLNLLSLSERLAFQIQSCSCFNGRPVWESIHDRISRELGLNSAMSPGEIPNTTETFGP
jgi:hypothetical protein